MTKVIGLCGYAGSGKSVAAEELERIGYRRVRFSEPLKNMLRAFYKSCGLSKAQIERRIEGDLKQTPDPLLGGKTPRYAMQTLGKEWGRDLIDENLWASAWGARVQKELKAGRKVVAEDVRFSTEDAQIRRFNGKIVKITRSAATPTEPLHASEMFIGVNPDMVVENESSLDSLRGWFRYVFDMKREVTSDDH